MTPYQGPSKANQNSRELGSWMETTPLYSDIILVKIRENEVFMSFLRFSLLINCLAIRSIKHNAESIKQKNIKSNIALPAWALRLCTKFLQEV